MRTYKRKTNRGASATQEQLQAAANAILKEGKSIRAAANEFHIPRMTLTRYMEKLKSQEHVTMGYTAPRQVFNINQKKILKDYLLKASAIFYGLTPKNVRSLAYHCAAKFDIKYPNSWKTEEMTGKDWLTAFLKRNLQLSIRKPEATSLGRATSFNKANVNMFFDKLATVLDRHNFTASCIWNIDETGVSTVCRPNKIIAAKGKRNVGSVTSGERGTNVTLIVAVSASGNTVPPMFIFPRKKYNNYFISNGPPDCIGAGNASGWVTDDEFYIFMEHFIKHVKPSVKSPILLLLDNHSSHLSIKSLDLAKSNGIVMLSFPPHCSHKLQPLDVSVFGPFKKYLSTVQDGWLRSHPGRTITIYDIPKIVAESLPLAVTGLNIINGFKKTGIFPYNRNVFTDIDFAPSYVTDRPENPIESHQSNSSIQITVETDQENSVPNIYENPVPSTSVQIAVDTNKENSAPNTYENPIPSTSFLPEAVIPMPSTSFSPEAVIPFPKAGPRKQPLNKRKKRKATILTDSPEKAALAEEQSKKTKKNSKGKKINKKKILRKSSSEDEEYYCIVCLEAYSDSLPGEKWIQCYKCRNWAHNKCKSGSGAIFICVNCDSDYDS